MQNITRDVISDLYVLYSSGDATADSRRLVEDFLSQDPEFAATLKESGGTVPILPAPLPPAHELKTLDHVKRRLSGPIWLLQLALIMSGLAFGRIISDTSFDVSPRKFIVTACIAAGFWIAFLVKLVRGRRAVLVRIR
jgi:hypothetical protein